MTKETNRQLLRTGGFSCLCYISQVVRVKEGRNKNVTSKHLLHINCFPLHSNISLWVTFCSITIHFSLTRQGIPLDQQKRDAVLKVTLHTTSWYMLINMGLITMECVFIHNSLQKTLSYFTDTTIICNIIAQVFLKHEWNAHAEKTIF